MDNNISRTVGQRCTGHVMNYVNLVNMDLIRPYPQRQDHKIPLNFLNNNRSCVLFPRDTYLFLPKIPLFICQMYLLKMQHGF